MKKFSSQKLGGRPLLAPQDSYGPAIEHQYSTILNCECKNVLISLTAIDKTSSIYIISQVIWYNDSNMKRGILTWWRSEAFILSFGRETGLLIFSLLVLFLSTISALICV